MGAYAPGLGTGLEDYARYKASRNPLGRAIAGDTQPMPDDGLGGLDAPVDPNAPTIAAGGGNESVTALSPLMPEAMNQGKMVMHPTLALVGDHGPEMVVPLDGKTSNKVGGMNGLRTRYR